MHLMPIINRSKHEKKYTSNKKHEIHYEKKSIQIFTYFIIHPIY